MTYDGSLARQLDQYSVENARESMVAYEGGGLDARARAGVSATFIPRAVLLLVIVFALCCIGAARVALTSGTVAILQRNEQLTSQISDIRTLNSDLQIERSLFSGSDRIGRIATQNLGMVHANEVELLQLG
ncbi:MAG: cell division protein FtsL [Atopobiaceae bacterium]|nr:cell division protein FtsL [Atopobiaceae bacterium]